MALLKNIIRGESLSILFTFPESYDMARIEKFEAVIGSKIYPHTISGQTAIVKLASEDTARLFGNQIITSVVQDSALGVQKPAAGYINVLTTQSRYESDAESDIYGLVIMLTVTETAISVSSVLYDYVKGDKGDPGAIQTISVDGVNVPIIADNVNIDLSGKVDKVTGEGLISDDITSRLSYNADEDTISYTRADGGTRELGKEISDEYTNKDTVVMYNKDIVSVVAVPGNRNAIKLTDATDDDLALATIGMVTVDEIAVNGSGEVAKIGKVKMIDTDGFGEGTTVWLDQSNPGQWTSTEPTSGRKIRIGTIVVESATVGVIDLNIFVYPLATDVLTSQQITNINDVQNKIDKAQNVLLKEPTGFASPELVVVTGDTSTRKITLSGTVSAYWHGEVVAALVAGYLSPAHGTDTTKQYYLSYNGTSIAWSETLWTFDQLQIAIAKYDATAAQWYYFRECHGLMDWRTHEELHRTVGTYKVSGGTFDGYTLSSTTAAERRPNVSETVIADEDLKTTLPALTSETYTQWHLTTGATDVYTLAAAEIVPVLAANPYYNQFTTDWVQTLMPANSVQSIWIYALPVAADVNSQKYRYLFMQGQWITQAGGASASQILAAVNAELLRLPSELNLNGLLGSEIIAIGRAVIAYTGGNWSIRNLSVLSGNKYSQVGSPSGNFLSVVTTDATLTGNGTLANPLSILTTINSGLLEKKSNRNLSNIPFDFTLTDLSLKKVTNISVPTYEGSGAAVHPSVVFIPESWNGYKYWMAMTPYPSSNIIFENPSIVASIDGITWVAPTGIINPIVAKPAVGYNSDTSLFYDGKYLHCLWRERIDTNINKVKIISSTDGITWTDEAILISETTKDVACPIMISENGVYYIFCINLDAATPPTAMQRYVSTDIRGAWTYVDDITIPITTGKQLWHFDIKNIGGNYVMFYLETTAGSSANGVRFCAKSKDLTTWETVSFTLPYIYPYQCSFVLANENNEYYFKVWDLQSANQTVHKLLEFSLKNLYKTHLSDVEIDINKSIAGATGYYIGDNFNRADSTTSPGTAQSGQAWNVLSGTFGIISRQMYLPSAANCKMIIDSTVYNHITEMHVVSTPVNDGQYIMTRCSNTSNYFRIGTAGATIIIQKVEAGVATTILSLTYTLKIMDILGVKCEGDVLSVLLNGVVIGSVSNSFNNTATNVGIQSNNTTVRIDKFLCRKL